MAMALGHRLRYLTSKHPFGSTKLPSWTSVKPRVKPSEPLAGGVRGGAGPGGGPSPLYYQPTRSALATRDNDAFVWRSFAGGRVIVMGC